MATLFISDLHLEPQRPQITRLFYDFLRGQARQAEALYILGDLFEVWIGDDACSPLAEEVADRLRALADSGVALHLMPGNRDFLLGKTFAARAGCQLLSDPFTIDLYGVRTLLLHGDTLCTQDVGYQRFRRIVRSAPCRRTFLALPATLRRRIAGSLRARSTAATRHKPAAIMDADPKAVVEVMRRHAVTRLIHGHTHRPAVHAVGRGGRRGERIVLGNWYAQGSVLRCTPEGYRLEILAPAA